MEIKTKLLSGEWVEVSPHTIMRLDAENAGLRDDLASERRNIMELAVPFGTMDKCAMIVKREVDKQEAK